MKISFVIPVYNRPNEVDELLTSFLGQNYEDCEIIIIEDGSAISSKSVVEKYQNQLTIRYLFHENQGPGKSRNAGASLSNSDYIVVLDSDIILPPNYISNLKQFIDAEDPDAFGGADSANANFSLTQKAINWSMTSFLTTGGIRNGKNIADRYYPRSFNMGVRRNVWEKLGGFADMRYGEDIDFSIRLYEAGYKVRFCPDIWVWHKRRATFKQFFWQTFHFGTARLALYNRHPQTLKLVHLLPSMFVIISSLFVLTCCIYSNLKLLLLFLIALAIPFFCVALYETKQVSVASLAVIAAITQLFGYGCGFIATLLTHFFNKK